MFLPTTHCENSNDISQQSNNTSDDQESGCIDMIAVQDGTDDIISQEMLYSNSAANASTESDADNKIPSLYAAPEQLDQLSFSMFNETLIHVSTQSRYTSGSLLVF